MSALSKNKKKRTLTRRAVSKKPPTEEHEEQTKVTPKKTSAIKTDEPAKVPQKPPSKRPVTVKAKVTEEETSTNAKKKEKDKEKEKEKEKEKKISNETLAVIDEYINNSGKLSILREAYKEIPEPSKDMKHEKCCENRDRIRFPDIPCFDDTRFILEPMEDEKNFNDFIHANKVSIEEVDRKYILAQAPKENAFEDFWRMVFQAQSAAIVVMCSTFENGKEASEVFWPQNNGDYKYFGKMFINNKKTEIAQGCTVCTIEVLPEGCSNSLVTKVHHFTTWDSNGGTQTRHILRLIRTVKMNEGGPTIVVSSEGIGRSAAYVLVDVVTTRLFKGISTKLVDIVIQLKKQRTHALNSELCFLTAAMTILDYIRVKLPKYNPLFDIFKVELGAM